MGFFFTFIHFKPVPALCLTNTKYFCLAFWEVFFLACDSVLVPVFFHSIHWVTRAHAVFIDIKILALAATLFLVISCDPSQSNQTKYQITQQISRTSRLFIVFFFLFFPVFSLCFGTNVCFRCLSTSCDHDNSIFLDL